MLCAGAGGYSYGSGKGGKDNSSSFLRIALLTCTASIVCDAVVPNFQQKLMASPAGGVVYSALPTTVHAEVPPISPTQTYARSCCDAFTGSTGGGGLGLTAAELMVNVNAVGFLGLLVHEIEWIASCRHR